MRFVDAGLLRKLSAERRGRGISSPAQLGHIPPSTFSAHEAQNVHSKEQILASGDSGARSLSQHSQFGLTSSIAFPTGQISRQAYFSLGALGTVGPPHPDIYNQASSRARLASGGMTVNRGDLESLTIAALDAAWSQHLAAANRQATQFAFALQSLRFAKTNVRPGGPLDDLVATLITARTAYCDKIRQENASFEELVKQTQLEVNKQAPATTQLYQQGRPAAYERLSQILRDLDGQILGAHSAMNQKLLNAQLEDSTLDHSLALFDLAKKQSEIYATINSHKK
jgi:hypothetical protein